MIINNKFYIKKHTLLIEEILDINGKNQLHKIKIGDRFITPFNELYKSKFKRVRFNSTGNIKGSKNEKNWSFFSKKKN